MSLCLHSRVCLIVLVWVFVRTFVCSHFQAAAASNVSLPCNYFLTSLVYHLMISLKLNMATPSINLTAVEVTRDQLAGAASSELATTPAHLSQP